MAKTLTDYLLRASLAEETVLSLPVATSIFGYWAQQIVEKLLNALLSENGKELHRIHNLRRIRRNVEAIGEKLPPLSYPVELLTLYATTYRYKPPPPMPDAERQQIRDAVRILREHVQARIAALRA